MGENSRSSIDHISDTAFWVATYRAEESERPDPLFKDTLARKLIGERGPRIAAEMPFANKMAFGLVMRTSAIDSFVEKAIALGVDTVINLGAGLDTRPYRMSLPRSLNWIEVDFPRLIDYKNVTLINDEPVCRLERIALDLSDDIKRRALFEKLGNMTKAALVITEGVVPYLTNDQALTLARDLAAIPTFKYWVQDYRAGKLDHSSRRALDRRLKESPLHFKVKDPIAFFAQVGWTVEQNVFLMDEAKRVGRELPLKFPWRHLGRILPRALYKLANVYGFVMFKRI